MPIATELYYFSHEAEDLDKKHPPVILIHGAGGNHLSWPPQIRRMVDERIYAIDLPGHGKSEGVGGHSIDEYADNVIDFMKELKIRAAVLVGISMGSAISLTIALKYPRKVIGLGLLGAGSKLRVAQAILENAGNPKTFESAVEMVNENCFSENTAPGLKQLSKEQMLELRPPVFLGDFLACNNFDVTSQLARIKIPAIILCGKEDKMTPPKFSELLQNGIANSQLHVVENAGHMVMTEQPDRVADLLKQFVDNLPLHNRKKKEHTIYDGQTAPVQKIESPLIDSS